MAAGRGDLQRCCETLRSLCKEHTLVSSASLFLLIRRAVRTLHVFTVLRAWLGCRLPPPPPVQDDAIFADTLAVLTEAGFSADEISALLATGAAK